jgi:hypothetical protein
MDVSLRRMAWPREARKRDRSLVEESHAGDAGAGGAVEARLPLRGDSSGCERRGASILRRKCSRV